MDNIVRSISKPKTIDLDLPDKDLRCPSVVPPLLVGVVVASLVMAGLIVTIEKSLPDARDQAEVAPDAAPAGKSPLDDARFPALIREQDERMLETSRKQARLQTLTALAKFLIAEKQAYNRDVDALDKDPSTSERVALECDMRKELLLRLEKVVTEANAR